MSIINNNKKFLAFLSAIIISFLPGAAVYAGEFAFPIIGPASYTNDFYGARANGRHGAIDIFAKKHQKVVSRTDGVITQIEYPEGDTSRTAGRYIIVRADNGYRYLYIHLNNDNPGTDDSRAITSLGYGPDLVEGNRVIEGQLLGYNGDSGNAETTPPHLHFEVTNSDREQINPYNGLKNNSYRVSSPKRNYPKVGNEILPTGTTFMGGVSISLGDVDGDDVDEIVSGANKGGTSVKTFEQDGTYISSFQPNSSSFKGGVDVATGDIDNDGVDEIIVGNGPGGTLVRIFEPDGTKIREFQPNKSTFKGGLSVATGDIDNDGVDEIIVGNGPGGTLVRIFEPDGTKIREFKPFETFKGGINVSSGNTTGDEAYEIIASAKKSGGPRISVYDNQAQRIFSKYVYSEDFKGGVKTEVANVSDGYAYDEILTIPESKGSAKVKMYRGNGSPVRYTNYFEGDYWRGHYDIAASDEAVFSSLGVDRRSSIRQVEGF